MKQNCNNHTICSPQRHVRSPWKCEISYVEYDPIENNLVIPTKPKHHQKTWAKTSHKVWFETLNFGQLMWCVYQFLSLSTCSNSMPLSTILLLPLAVRWRESEIQSWLWSILHNRNGNIRKWATSLSFSSFTRNEYMAWIAHGAKTTYFNHIKQQSSTSEKINK